MGKIEITPEEFGRSMEDVTLKHLCNMFNYPYELIYGGRNSGKKHDFKDWFEDWLNNGSVPYESSITEQILWNNADDCEYEVIESKPNKKLSIEEFLIQINKK